MPKVTHNRLNSSLGEESSEKKTSKEFETKVNSVSNSDNNLALHRGLEDQSSDPYSYNKKNLLMKITRKLKLTLGSSNTSPRCSAHVSYIKFNKFTRIIGSFASVLLFILTSLFVCPVVIKNNVAEGASSPVTSETTLTIATDESANLDLIVKSSSGTFATSSSSDLANFSVTTNNYTGYTLSISASDNNQKLTNSNTGDTIESITSAVNADKFTSSGDTLNKWGYLPSKLNSKANTDYQPAPTKESATVLDETSSANTTANNYTIGLGAKVDYTVASGLYSNTYILTAVANPVAYAITYADSTGEATSLPSVQTSSDTPSATGTSVALAPDRTPERSGYAFKSWCLGTANTAGALPSATTCTGTEYSSGDTMYLDQTTGNAITLYAVWTIAIQNLTANMCSTLATSSNYRAFDLRDNKYYNVRYINGNCWMTSNLRFTGTPTDAAGKMTLDNSTSDVSANYATTNPLTVNYGSLTAGNSYTEPRIITGSNSYSDGETVWYNYAAASVGSVTGDNNTTEASYSVCPAGWKLPTRNELASISSYSDQYSITYGGSYADGTLSSTDVGFWWSSTATDATVRYYAYALSGKMYVSSGSGDRGREMGRYVRCIKINKISDVVSMQQLGSLNGVTKTAVIDSMTTNTGYALPDIRDSKTYTIKKLATGDVWMTDNLYFNGTSINSETTNIDTTKNITWKSLVNDSVCKGEVNTVGNTTNWCYLLGTNTAWYNYAASSAGTITGLSDKNDQVYDICSSGWKLPTYQQAYEIRNYMASFSPTKTGNYVNGVQQQASDALYWTSTVGGIVVPGSEDTNRMTLHYVNSSASVSADQNTRRIGNSLRCVLK